MVALLDDYAKIFPREGRAIHSQWTSFGFQLADALSQASGAAWTPDHPDEVHSVPQHASWTLRRADGFRLRFALHGRQGVASMDDPCRRGHVVHDRSAPAPLGLHRPTHVFDPTRPVETVAAEILARVVTPSEPHFRRRREIEDRRAATAESLAKASAALAEVTGPCVSNPRDADGRSHLLHQGNVIGRFRLGRGG